MALWVLGVSCIDGIAKAFPLHFLAPKDSSSLRITVLIICSIKLRSPRGLFTWCNYLVSWHGTSLFPVGFAPIQRQRKLKKRLHLTAMIANAIYVCKHVQCIFSVNFGCTAMVLPLLKSAPFCCSPLSLYPCRICDSEAAGGWTCVSTSAGVSTSAVWKEG